jgi:hypothetical protein
MIRKKQSQRTDLPRGDNGLDDRLGADGCLCRNLRRGLAELGLLLERLLLRVELGLARRDVLHEAVHSEDKVGGAGVVRAVVRGFLQHTIAMQPIL